MSPWRLACILAPMFLGAQNLVAHETWLMPSTFTAAPGQLVTFDLTSGMHFATLDFAIRPERVAQSGGRVAGEKFGLAPGTRGKSSLHFEQVLARPGLTAAWVVLAPKTLELSEAKVAEYYEEINASREVRDIWARQKGRIAWRETYTKCAKTFVRVGQGNGDDWKTPVGMPLEIIPRRAPANWKSGDEVELELLENGKPLRASAIGLIFEGDDKRVFRTTDAEGCATFPLTQSGRILLFAVHLQWSGSEWSSNFTTLTARAAPR